MFANLKKKKKNRNASNIKRSHVGSPEEGQMILRKNKN